MCSGGRLLADFVAGLGEVPEVPEAVTSCLTWTVDGDSVVLAHKVARSAAEGFFVPLTGGEPYPADAVASCLFRSGHEAPDLYCTCGFHAVSSLEAWGIGSRSGAVNLDVALSGRVLAFEWEPGGVRYQGAGQIEFGPVGVLFRAARQTVISLPESEWVVAPSPPRRAIHPDGPSGVLTRRRGRQPRGAGPARIELPKGPPIRVEVRDDAGYCDLELGLAAPATVGAAESIIERIWSGVAEHVTDGVEELQRWRDEQASHTYP